MTTEFVAGFISGVAGLMIGSPFDIIKTAKQAGYTTSDSRLTLARPSSWFNGLLAPILGLGFMNAILFWSYHLVISGTSPSQHVPSELLRVYSAGFFSGLCVCFISVPTEVIKVQAQTSGTASWRIVRQCLETSGTAGLFVGFSITVARDAIGYGFYFMAFEGLCLLLPRYTSPNSTVLLSGGLAGCISWLSIFPLDTIKTRLQAKADLSAAEEETLLTHDANARKCPQTVQECAASIYNEHGVSGFFEGALIATFRAFLVNAVIFWIDALVRQILW